MTVRIYKFNIAANTLEKYAEKIKPILLRAEEWIRSQLDFALRIIKLG